MVGSSGRFGRWQRLRQLKKKLMVEEGVSIESGLKAEGATVAENSTKEMSRHGGKSPCHRM
jgi:hypothetical protein